MRRRLFLLRIAVLNTFKKRLRATLALGSISFSVCVMVVLFGVGAGLRNIVLETIGGANVRDVVTASPRNVGGVKLDQVNVSKIGSISGVSTVEQSVGVVGKISYRGIDLYMPTYAITDDYLSLAPENTISGDLNKLKSKSGNMAVNSGALQAFGLSAKEAIGKKFSISVNIDRTYATKQDVQTKQTEVFIATIVAITNKGSSPVAYLPLNVLSERGVDSASQLKIRLSDPDKSVAVRESIEQLGFQTSSIQDTIDEANRIFSVIQRVLVIFGVIAFAVTVFGTFNTITLTLIEETKQIGFLRIMGLHRRDVGFLFVAQSMMLTVMGALVGIVAGVVIGQLGNEMTSSLSEDVSAFGPVYLFQIPSVQIIIMLMLSILIGWLIGLMPAKRAVTIGPLEALKS